MHETGNASRALRRVVASVGQLPLHEITQILGDLDERERGQVAPLLAELLAQDQSSQMADGHGDMSYTSRAVWRRRLDHAPDWLICALMGRSGSERNPAMQDLLGRSRLREATRDFEAVQVTAATRDALARILAEPRIEQLAQRDARGVKEVFSRIRRVWVNTWRTS